MKFIKEQIYDIIPNRYPLMILDTLEVENDLAIGEIFLKENTWFFDCHYPGNPILPLSLLVESMSQVFASVFLSKISQKEIPVIYSIGEIKMSDSVRPGDKLQLKAELLSFRRGIAKGKCYAYKNDGPSICEFGIVDVLPSYMQKIK